MKYTYTYALNCPWLAHSVARFYNCKYNINEGIYWFTGEWDGKLIFRHIEDMSVILISRNVFNLNNYIE